VNVNAVVLTLALTLAPQADTVPLYTDLGSHHHAISTKVPKAQQYFDQGLRLAFAFNHAEAIRAFREAARLDPKCAICWWGVAYSYGPNINLPMDSAGGAAAWDAVTKAKALKPNATLQERAYINAIEKRYGADALADRAQRDSAYAKAMQMLAGEYPDDLDAAAIAAEAAMDLRPWQYWQADGSPYPGTEGIVRNLERIITANPNHPGACHFYIHAVEAVQAEKAVACAERLAGLMPGAGHLVHMPAHIYIRVGRWNDAIETNKHAVHADERFIASEKPSGFYPVMYYPHNHHFLSFASIMAGRKALALEHARHTRSNIPVEAAAQFPALQNLSSYPYLALVSFGAWDELLKEPDPPANHRLATGLATYAKGIAHAALGHADVAQAHLDKLVAIGNEFGEDAGTLDKVMDIAHHALAGEIAYRATKDLVAAEQHFRAALKIEDSMIYIEPPDWYYPIRQSLAAVLVDAGKPADAEQLYREDLKRFPENVWSLKGLALALHAQNKLADAGDVDARLRTATQNSDVTLTKSRF
jgi:tetratricopeptide (TPR) repeat protein